MKLTERLFPWIAGAVVGRLSAFYGAMIVGIAGVALSVAWHAGPYKYLEARQFATLTQRTDARIVESWLAVDFDPARRGTHTNWRPFAKASPCVVVEYQTEWTGPARRAFCGTRLPFYDHYTLHDLAEVSPGVPFGWGRDERGFIVPEIRVSPEAMRNLAAGTDLTGLRAAYERPDDDAVVSWSRTAPGFPIAIDPAHPGATWPVGYVNDMERRTPGWFTAAIGFLIGAAMWTFGMRIIAVGQSRLVVALLVIVPLAALPWWGESFPRWVRGMNEGFGDVIADMLGTIDALDRMAATAPEDAALAQGERIVWHVGGGSYAETVGRIAFRLPSPPPADADAALNALADTVAAQMRAFDEPTRTAILEQLAKDKIDGKSKAGYMFLRAAREAFVDENSKAARRFLEAWVTQPVEEPWPRDPGFETRIRLLRELTTIPPPNYISIPASWIVERAEGRRAKDAATR
ncbi:MAG: hypothetical protein U1F15_07930 [Burkholderiales bacterium]